MTSGVILTLITPFLIAAIITLDEQLVVRGLRWFYVNGYRLSHSWWINVAFYALIGWSVGRVARRRQAAVIFMFAVSICASGVVSLIVVQTSVDVVNLSYELAFHCFRFNGLFHNTQAVVFNVGSFPW
jgi:hypothetical protein